MANVFEKLEVNPSIFRNEDCLSPEFVPEELPGRHAQEIELAAALKPAASGGRPANCFVSGPSGTGKTSCCKRVAEQLREYSGKAFCLYSNCWQHSTEQAVLSQVALKIGAGLPRRGVSSDEIFERVTQHFKKNKITPIIVLDEADRLFFDGEEKLLYRLSRSAEESGVHFGIVLVTNDKTLIARADARIRSSLSPKQIDFKPYSPGELKEILNYRAKLALAPGAWDDEVIALCAAHGAKNGGDARMALQALWLAAKGAEARDAKKINLDDVRKGMGKSSTSTEQKHERDAELLGDKEKIMLEMISEGEEGVEVGKLYEEYAAKHGTSERSMRSYLRELEFKGLVETRPLEGGKKIAKRI